MGVDVNLSIASAQQYARSAPTSQFGDRHLLGAARDTETSPPYNIWLRYELPISRFLQSVRFTLEYSFAMNDPEMVQGWTFHASFGTENAPGTEKLPFIWNIYSQKSPEIFFDRYFTPGRYWLWLTDTYAGQSRGYVEGVEFRYLIGEAVGIARISDGTTMQNYQAYICDGAAWHPAEIYLNDGATWSPCI